MDHATHGRHLQEKMHREWHDHVNRHGPSQAHVVRHGHQPEYKSKLALHTNHNPGIAGSDEVMK